MFEHLSGVFVKSSHNRLSPEEVPDVIHNFVISPEEVQLLGGMQDFLRLRFGHSPEVRKVDILPDL